MRRWGTALVVAVLATLILSGIAEAKGQRYVGYQAHTGAGDFTVDVVAGREGRTFYVAVSRTAPWTSEQTSYVSTTGSADNGRLHGRIGNRGHAELRFQQRGRREVEREGCVRYVTTHGRFVGNFRFRGERRYVDVHERRLGGRKTVLDLRRCAFDLSERREPARAALTACGARGLVYQVRRDAGRTALIVFGPTARADGYRRSSFVFRGMRNSYFTVADDFTTARLAPPAPFKGVSRYESGEITGHLDWRTLTGEWVSLTDVRDVSLAPTDRNACAGFITTGRRGRVLKGEQEMIDRFGRPGALAPGRAYAPAPAGSAAG